MLYKPINAIWCDRIDMAKRMTSGWTIAVHQCRTRDLHEPNQIIRTTVECAEEAVRFIEE